MTSIDKLSIGVGKVASYLIIPMIGVTLYEVFMRRVLNMPTTWAFDMTTWIYGAHFMLGLAWVMYHRAHVRIDIIINLFPKTFRDFVNVLTFLVLFVPYLIGLVYGGVEFATDSWAMWEKGQNAWGTSNWPPPIYPIKTVIPVAALLLLLQGIANFLKDVGEMGGKGK
jgi:TRAP-type mannitol/chloroaromatic compound transport system permease small subunit